MKLKVKQKKQFNLRWVGWAFGLIGVMWMIIYFFPTTNSTKHAYFDHDRPLIIAHQGGEHLAPSGTLEAFKNAAQLGVDVIEFDIHMTKDGHLVSIHDPTVDRTTNGSGKINDMTLNEVQSLDAGEYFVDLDGEYSYRDEGVYIPTVVEAFEAIPDIQWNIEIKDTNDPALYEEISTKLWKIIQEYELEEQVLIASFNHDIIEMVLQASEGDALVSGGRGEITKFVILHKLFLNGLYHSDIQAIQIPTFEGKINLKDKKIIKGAKQEAMDVHYWTINDQETMKELLDLGADGIITDRPDLMIDLLE